MTSTFHINENELTDEFLKSIKAVFKNKSITLTITEDLDATEYLLATSANQKHIQKSIHDLQMGQGKEMTLTQLKKFAKKE